MKRILITGSRSGIAKRVIDKLKDKDYYIYATTHTELQAKRLKEIYKDYKNIECFKLDITDEIDRKKATNLKIDILLCNAAISNGGSLLEIDIKRVRENYEVNIFGNLELIQNVLKQMINRDGKVIIMSSLASIIPLNFIGAYASTKASLIKIAETLKNELELIRTKESLILNLLGQNNYDSIVNKIVKAIESDNPKFIYRAPLLQVVGAKIYSLLFE